MTISILLSTMNQKDDSILNKMNVKSDSIIINQTDLNGEIEHTKENNTVKLISSTDRGLSKSRNLAIKNCKADIGVIADDDLVYVENYENIIEKTFEVNTDYDIIAFIVEGKNKKFKDYKNSECEVGYLKSMKISSVQIAMRLKNIKKKNIKFNEMFGSGAKYLMGEENIFLFDCLNNNLKIKFVPIKIADLYIGDSTWFNGFNEKYFNDRGAIFAALSKKWSYILIAQFLIRHYKSYRKDISIVKALKSMMSGRNEYISFIVN